MQRPSFPLALGLPAFFLATGIPTHAQSGGTVNFANDSSCKVINGQTASPATDVNAALYWAPTNSTSFTQVGSSVTVGIPLPGIFAGGTRTTGPATSGGAEGWFQVHAWGGGYATYEQALAAPGTLVGASAILQVVTGNPVGEPPTPPGSLVAAGLQSFLLNPTSGQPLVRTCATNKTVVCDTAWQFDEPATSGGCAAITLTVLSTVTNGDCPQLITRTWRATDGCSTKTCSQTLTVVDDTPPAISCAGDKTVACGAAWSFDSPNATDSCSGTNVSVMVFATVTNNVCPLVVTRTWLATDACGNTNTCSQTVTAPHLSPLTLTCASNKVVSCDSARDFDPPAAFDECGATNSAVTVLGTVTNTRCPLALTRTWGVTNPCDTNLITCSQTVTFFCPDCPVLVVAKACPAHPVPPGGTLVWTGSVTNASEIVLSNVVVLNDRPSSDTVVFGPATLAPGESASFSGGYSVHACSCGPHTDTLTATGVAAAGIVFSNFVTVSCAGTNVIIPGDMNGDGIVDQAELNAVLVNYWLHSPWIYMTNATLLCDGRFQFALTNATGWNFTVLASTNLIDWTNLPGPAYPVYQFRDPEGTNAPQRAYRLRWP